MQLQAIANKKEKKNTFRKQSAERNRFQEMDGV